MAQKIARPSRPRPEKAEAARPRGPENVRAALFSAAISLFGERGPDVVSLRDIAARANVNHGLVHRYFGTKDQLLGAIIDFHAAEYGAVIDDADLPADAVSKMLDLMMERPSLARIFAHMLVNGHPPEQIASKDGGSAHLAAFLAAIGTKDVDPKLLAAICTVLVLGWSLYESFILYAVDHDGSVETARNALKLVMKQMLEKQLVPETRA